MRYVLGVCLVCLTIGTAGGAEKASPAGSGLYVGWAAADITPERPVALIGQLRKRISPHLIYRKQAEDIMRQRRGLARRQEIARRIVDAVGDVLPLAKKEIETDVIFRHIVAKADLPTAQSAVLPFYETDSVTPIEFHVIRLGDIAIATNPFELYLDYGVRIKSRSPATMTMLVQLSCRHCGYLPTEKAVQGGGYSADKYAVGPEGGQTLVNETLKHINAVWQ